MFTWRDSRELFQRQREMTLIDSTVGILSGTFDPVHLGHMTVADEAMRQLGLSEILLIPTSYSFGKRSTDMTPINHRREMLRIAIKDIPFLTLSSLHITRANIETSWEIIRTYADRHGQRQVFLLMGCDAFNHLPQWDQLRRAIELCRIVVFPRRGCRLPDLEHLQSSLQGIIESITILDMVPVDVSSSEIRQRVRQGLTITGLVSRNVADYIYRYGLYREITQ